jgi:hypothetical protein
VADVRRRSLRPVQPAVRHDRPGSAGLNLYLERYFLDFGERGTIGPTDASVRVACEVRSAAVEVPHRLPELTARIGIDRAPVDVTDPDKARWLMACVWPDTGRLERTRAAIELASQDPPRLRTGDMIDGVRVALAEAPGPAAVITSWSYGYLPPEVRPDFHAALAGSAHPVAWVVGDGAGVVDLLPVPDGEGFPNVLGLVVFDGGAPRAELLGVVHQHGAWIDAA